MCSAAYRLPSEQTSKKIETVFFQMLRGKIVEHRSHKTYSGTHSSGRNILWSATVNGVTVVAIVATMTLPFWIVAILQGSV